MSVWETNWRNRGKIIEAYLAQTEYAGWFNVGQENHGYFPYIDFQRGNQVVSLKTSQSEESVNDFQNNILDLQDVEVENRGVQATFDLRVPTQQLASYYQAQLGNFAARHGVNLQISVLNATVVLKSR